MNLKIMYRKYAPANAISGRSGGGNDEESLAAAKNANLFLNTCKKKRVKNRKFELYDKSKHG